MTSPRAFLCSTLGRKVVMAVTGVILFGFVIGHLAGNLLLYRGQDAINAYAVGLRHLGAGLWAARLILLIAVALHIWAATSLTRSNWRARPQGYAQRKNLTSTYASRTMVWSGPILLLFIVYHLLHFTFGTVHPNFIEGDVYNNVVHGFSVPLVSVAYIVAMLALGLHLYHGAYSMFQSVGANHPRINRARRTFATLFAIVIVLGNISFPIAVMAGLVRERPPIHAGL
jgi:succinate dehydrogenase / fumarate reductase cytochrome b subunit